MPADTHIDTRVLTACKLAHSQFCKLIRDGERDGCAFLSPNMAAGGNPRQWRVSKLLASSFFCEHCSYSRFDIKVRADEVLGITRGCRWGDMQLLRHLMSAFRLIVSSQSLCNVSTVNGEGLTLNPMVRR